VQKETEICSVETRLISEVRRCLGNSELGGKKIALNSTCPVGCVLWEIHSSKIKKYVGRRVKVFCPECGPVSKLKKMKGRFTLRCVKSIIIETWKYLSKGSGQ